MRRNHVEQRLYSAKTVIDSVITADATCKLQYCDYLFVVPRLHGVHGTAEYKMHSDPLWPPMSDLYAD